MTLWAIVSDIHGRGDRLARVLADAQSLRAERVLALGDIASPVALDMLQAVDAEYVFGNWEASGLRGQRAPYRGWIARWPAQFRADGFLAAHASPVWPPKLSIAHVVEHLRSNNLHWSALFPSIRHSEEARWAAFAELDAEDISVFFHGHTHVQEAWRWPPGGAPSHIPGSAGELTLDAAARWLIGVGSVGEPHDGAGAAYALYDTAARLLRWRRV
ncbi:MAG: Calcineurin-like phosphoesterase superfamily domain protein [Chloroflexi bacterium ADurb.Bin325]|nr:MAG: Calcineurin-like phosphoesterase superfamily domain protein [Chloroflexi bacterium ADurb.Bin325]